MRAPPGEGFTACGACIVITSGNGVENLACLELRRRGHEISDRRYRTRIGELDVIARDGDTLVFVEVKTRATESFGSAFDAITRSKRRVIVQMAGDYLTRRRSWNGPCRFDVVAVTIPDDGRPRINIVAGAFGAEA